MSPPSVSFLLKAYRLSDVTQRTLARRVGVHEVTLTRIENGLRCREATAERIIQTLAELLEKRAHHSAESAARLRSWLADRHTVTRREPQ